MMQMGASKEEGGKDLGELMAKAKQQPEKIQKQGSKRNNMNG